MPADSFTKELWSASLDSMLNIKERWKCSIGAMIKRCEHLEIINEEQAKRLWINYSRRGWRSGEPLDNRVPHEIPTLIRKSFEMLVNEGGLSRRQILLQMHMNANDIEEIACLPNGFFAAQEGGAGLLLKLKAREVGHAVEGAEVIDFGKARKG